MADDAVEIPLEPTVSKTILDQFKQTFITTLDDALEEAFKNLPAAVAGAQFPEMKGAGAAAQGAGSGNIAGKVQAGANIAGMAAGMDIKGLLGAGGPWGQAISAAVSAVGALKDTIVGFVQAANPEIVELLNDTIADISGVIGQSLTPVVEAAIPFVRMFGDFLASILPDAEGMRLALEPLQEALMALRSAIDPLIPLISGALRDGLIHFAVAVKLAVEALKYLTQFIPGLGGKSGNFKSSVGAARKSGASYQSVEEVGRGMQLAGFNSLADKSMNAQIAAAASLASIDAKTKGSSGQPAALGNA